MDGEYRVVATVSAEGVSRDVRCRGRPNPQEINLLFALGEHVSRVISLDDLCHRMKVSVNALRQHATGLRKKLDHDWSIESISNRGMRLCYLGSQLAEADVTTVKVDPEAVRRRRVQTAETRRKIRETQIRKESWRYFHQGRTAGKE